jgi:hypothetical protein
MLDNNVYRVSVRTEDWSERDMRLMEKYGEPEIDAGGVFYDGAITFEIDNDYKCVKSESPFAQGFDARDFDDAEDRAEIWATEIGSRITTAITTLRQNDDDYSREEVATV